jgi:hypothetical protein
MNEKNDFALETLLSEVRALRATPSDALLARMMADARTVIESTAPEAARRPVIAPSASSLRRWLGALPDLLGGWRAMSVLTASAAVGIGLSLFQPAGLPKVFASSSEDTVGVSMGLDTNPLSIFGG